MKEKNQPLEADQERQRSWGYRVEKLHAKKNDICAIQKCRELAQYAVYYCYQAKSKGREVQVCRSFCEKHALRFAKKHHIEFPGPGGNRQFNFIHESGLR